MVKPLSAWEGLIIELRELMQRFGFEVEFWVWVVVVQYFMETFYFREVAPLRL